MPTFNLLNWFDVDYRTRSEDGSWLADENELHTIALARRPELEFR
jgi:hypothetical protein